MLSVDLAASSVLNSWNIEHTLINFQKRPWRLPSKFRVCRTSAKLAQFTHLLFWGDFQNNPIYGTRDFANREMKFGYASTKQDAISNWTRLHLSLAQELPRSTVIASIGNCFLGTHSATAEHNLFEPLKTFADSAISILPREARSEKELVEAAGGAPRDNIRSALDTAFLLEFGESVDPRERECFGYCFARSGVADIAEGVQKISERTGLTAVEVPWSVGTRRVSQEKIFARALEVVPKCRFIVSDVYHLTVNAMNHGTPVLAVSRLDSPTQSSVDDQKKYALAEQIGATDLHIALGADASILSSVSSIIETYERLMDREISFDEIRQGLRSRKDRYRSAIKDILDA